jgi:hypothetical protein
MIFTSVLVPTFGGVPNACAGMPRHSTAALGFHEKSQGKHASVIGREGLIDQQFLLKEVER